MGKGDKKSRRGKITNGSYGKRRPRKSSVSNVVIAKPKKVSAEKADQKAKTAPKATASQSDRETVNFSEDHELNYHLKKNGLSSSKDNRAKLVELGSELKKKLDKNILTHEEVDALIEKNVSDFKAIGQK